MITSAPLVFTHVKRPEWGRAVVLADLLDRCRYAFENGGERTFLRGDPQVVQIELAIDEREALAKTLLKRHAPARVSKARAAAAKAKKAAKAAEEPD